MKLTSPKDKDIPTEESITTLLKQFEEKLEEEKNHQNYYHITVRGEHPKPVLEEIEKRYLAVGWVKVECKTSSQRNEPAGLTSLRLWVTGG